MQAQQSVSPVQVELGSEAKAAVKQALGMSQQKTERKQLTWTQISKSLLAGGVAGAV